MGIYSNDISKIDEIIKDIKANESNQTLHKNYISGEDFDRLISGDKYKSCFDEN